MIRVHSTKNDEMRILNFGTLSLRGLSKEGNLTGEWRNGGFSIGGAAKAQSSRFRSNMAVFIIHYVFSDSYEQKFLSEATM